MFKKVLLYISAIILLSFISSCDGGMDSKKKIGMFVVGEGYNDAGYTQNCKKGLLEALKVYPFDTMFVSSLTHTQEEIDYFAEKGFDALFLAGSLASEELLVSAANNPEMQFFIVDYTYRGLLKNVQCINFNIDEAAMPCGFIAAYWASRIDPENPVLAMIGGIDIPAINSFIAAYISGMNFYNKKYNASVKVIKYYLNSFDNDSLGYNVADSLIKNCNADIILPVAGNAGKGSLYAAKDNQKWGVGVDTDQYYSLPEIGDILLTSCMKSLETTVFSVAKTYLQNPVVSPGTYTGELSNEGVTMAPFHNFENIIPDYVKAEIEIIKLGIIEGKIYTGI